jgi:hypothetical protein
MYWNVKALLETKESLDFESPTTKPFAFEIGHILTVCLYPVPCKQPPGFDVQVDCSRAVMVW